MGDRPDRWGLLRGVLAKATPGQLSQRQWLRLQTAGVLELLEQAAKGSLLAISLLGKFDSAADLVQALIDDGEITPLALAGAFIMSVNHKDGFDDADLYLNQLLETPEVLLLAVRCALQKDLKFRARWWELGMHDVGALDWLERRLREVDPGEVDQDFLELAEQAQAAGHPWAVLVVLIDCLLDTLYLSDRHFPGVVTRDYFAKAVDAFAIVKDFRPFTRAEQDLFFFFFALLIRAFSAEELRWVGFTLPAVGGNMAHNFCRQVRTCGVFVQDFCWRLSGKDGLLEDNYSCYDICTFMAGGLSLGVLHNEDYRVLGLCAVNVFNLVANPQFFLDLLRDLWDQAETTQEPAETENRPIRQTVTRYVEDGIVLLIRRFLDFAPHSVFSLKTIQQIPGAGTFRMPVDEFTLEGLAGFLDFAKESGPKESRARGAFIFAVEGLLPNEIFREIFSHAFGETLVEFLHLKRRTALDYMHHKKAQCQTSITLTAKLDLRKEEWERVYAEGCQLDSEKALLKEQGLVAQLREEKEELAQLLEKKEGLVAELLEKKEGLVAELPKEKKELVAQRSRGEKRSASSEAEKPPALKASRTAEVLVADPPCRVEELPRGEKRSASEEAENPPDLKASRTVKVLVAYLSTRPESPLDGDDRSLSVSVDKPPVVLPHSPVGLPSVGLFTATNDNLGDLPHSPALRPSLRLLEGSDEGSDDSGDEDSDDFGDGDSDDSGDGYSDDSGDEDSGDSGDEDSGDSDDSDDSEDSVDWSDGDDPRDKDFPTP